MGLLIAKVRLDGGTQMRVQTDQATVEEYADYLRAGGDLPPIVVFRDAARRYWLADGFHRLLAYLACGRKYIECDVRQGEQRAAVLFAAGTNQRHGLRRTNADKRKCVLALLADEEWGRWSMRQIAEHCGVSDGLVRMLKDEMRGAHETQLSDMCDDGDDDEPTAAADPLARMPRVWPRWRNLLLAIAGPTELGQALGDRVSGRVLSALEELRQAVAADAAEAEAEAEEAA